MTDPDDQLLKDRLAALAGAVPVRSTWRLIPTMKPTRRAPWAGAGAVALLAALGAGLVIVLAGVVGGGAREPSPPPSPSSATVATVDNGPFRLTIRTDATRYGEGAQIGVTATFEYIGENEQIVLSSHPDLVGFGVEEVGGPRHATPAYRMSSVSYTVQRGVPLTFDFHKSGGIIGNGENDAFLRTYLNDPLLRLPSGTWQIYATVDAAAVRAALTVVVFGSASATPSVAPSPTDKGQPSIAPLTATRPPAGAALPYPDGCAAYELSERRCAYIVDWAKKQAGYAADAAVTVELFGCPLDSCFVALTQEFVVRIRVVDTSGESTDESVFCGVGGEYTLLCTDRPVVNTSTPMSGYGDVPCRTENGPCATPVPTPAPKAVSASVPLHVDSLDIPIDHIGSYAIDVGEAHLPNGILSDATFTLADDAPADVLLEPRGIEMVITSRADGSRLENRYQHGWRPGTERVGVTLHFSVEWFEPGATLRVVDLDVH